jgi:hypothetical protein
VLFVLVNSVIPDSAQPKSGTSNALAGGWQGGGKLERSDAGDPGLRPLREGDTGMTSEGYAGGQPSNLPTLTAVSVVRLSGLMGFIEAAPWPVKRSTRLPLIALPTSDAYQ